MGNWNIHWNFNKPSYSLGEQISVSYWMKNTGEYPLYLSDLKLIFDFGTYNLETIQGNVAPREDRFLGNIRITLPKNVIGRQLFTLKYHLHELVNNNWVDLGTFSSEKQYFISIYPKPLYGVFVSRGLLVEDRAIGNPIAETVREWGFKTVTVGIEVDVPEEQVLMRIKEEIQKSEAVIAIATPRFMDALTGTWRTLEWLHDELGIAFGIDKPLLILKDKRVTLGGLPSYLSKQNKVPPVEFDPYNLDELKIALSNIMPDFRDWIETKRKQAFNEKLGELALGGLAVVGFIAVVSGIIGALSDSS